MERPDEGKRISLKRKSPNPYFQQCLEVLHQEAVMKKSRLEPMLLEALTSLSKYPLPLQTGADCAILQGFNRKLCALLDKYLELNNVNNGQKNSESSESSDDEQSKSTGNNILVLRNSKNQLSQCSVGSQELSSEELALANSQKALNGPSQSDSTSTNSYKSTQKSPRGHKYKPVFRSGSYAILLALLEHSKENPNNSKLKKDELIDKAQKYSEESFTRPRPESFYTAWSNMKTLVTKKLVKQSRSKTMHYSLTEEGALLATELLEISKHNPTVNDIIFNNGASTSAESTKSNSEASSSGAIHNDPVAEPQISALSVTFVDMPPGSFDIILLIDKQETGGVSKKNDPTVAQFNKYPDLNYEYRNLKVGDFTWIARDKSNKNQELVLPYIVERKRMDDLGASIKDGRFHEQKFRLRKCGIKNILYLVENYGKNKHVGLPVQSLQQAVVNTRVQDNFKVHVTDSLTNSVMFLAMLTKRLKIEYKGKTLAGCNKNPEGEKLMTFSYFNKTAIKNRPLSVKETFIKLLLQSKGISVEKALAVTDVYQTPRLLIKAYEECDSQKECEVLLASLKYRELSRKVGPSVSKSIYQLLTLR